MIDFGRQKSHKSMDFFAKKDAKIQPALFTLDYLNSLKAAFTYTDLILAILAAPKSAVYFDNGLRLLLKHGATEQCCILNT